MGQAIVVFSSKFCSIPAFGGRGQKLITQRASEDWRLASASLICGPPAYVCVCFCMTPPVSVAASAPIPALMGIPQNAHVLACAAWTAWVISGFVPSASEGASLPAFK